MGYSNGGYPQDVHMKKQVLISVISVAMLTACAKRPADPQDPLENYNRTMFAFNMSMDHLIIRPVAKTYNAITPNFLQTGVSNVADNINVINTFINDILQANFTYLPVDFWRFVINGTAGIGGLFDVATKAGLPPHFESFGLTLAKWRGGKQSSYFVIPLFGPSTITNGIGFAFDYYTTPWPYIQDQNINYIFHGIKFTNIRAQYLSSDKMVDTAFDPYVFVRDVYLQKDKDAITKNMALGRPRDQLEQYHMAFLGLSRAFFKSLL